MAADRFFYLCPGFLYFFRLWPICSGAENRSRAQYSVKHFKKINAIIGIAYVIVGILLTIVMSRALVLLYHALKQEGAF